MVRLVCRAALLVAACGLSLTFSAATAEAQGQAPGAKSAQPPQPVPAEPGATTASFGDWVLRCQRASEGEKSVRVCEVVQSMQLQGQATPIAQIAIGRLRSEPLRVTVVLPVNVGFANGVQIQAGEARTGEKGAPGLDLAWRRCLPGGCFADSVVGDDVLKRWRSIAEPGRIAFKDATGRDITLPLSFRGLGQSLDALSKEGF